jgi:hypothetical protein
MEWCEALRHTAGSEPRRMTCATTQCGRGNVPQRSPRPHWRSCTHHASAAQASTSPHPRKEGADDGPDRRRQHAPDLPQRSLIPHGATAGQSEHLAEQVHRTLVISLQGRALRSVSRQPHTPRGLLCGGLAGHAVRWAPCIAAAEPGAHTDTDRRRRTRIHRLASHCIAWKESAGNTGRQSTRSTQPHLGEAGLAPLERLRGADGRVVRGGRRRHYDIVASLLSPAHHQPPCRDAS